MVEPVSTLSIAAVSLASSLETWELLSFLFRPSMSIIGNLFGRFYRDRD